MKKYERIKDEDNSNTPRKPRRPRPGQATSDYPLGYQTSELQDLLAEEENTNSATKVAMPFYHPPRPHASAPTFDDNLLPPATTTAYSTQTPYLATPAFGAAVDTPTTATTTTTSASLMDLNLEEVTNRLTQVTKKELDAKTASDTSDNDESSEDELDHMQETHDDHDNHHHYIQHHDHDGEHADTDESPEYTLEDIVIKPDNTLSKFLKEPDNLTKFLTPGRDEVAADKFARPDKKPFSQMITQGNTPDLLLMEPPSFPLQQTNFIDSVIHAINPQGEYFPSTSTIQFKEVKQGTIAITKRPHEHMGHEIILIGPGRRFTGFRHEYTGVEINVGVLQTQGLYEYENRLTIVRVDPGEIGFAFVNGKPTLLSPGWHLHNDSRFQYLFSLNLSTGQISRESQANRVDKTSILKLFDITLPSNIPSNAIVVRRTTAATVVPSVAKSTSITASVATTASTAQSATTATSKPAIAIRHDAQQLIIVQPGYIGLAFDNQNPIFYGEGYHWVSSSIRLTGVVPSNFSYFQHGNLSVFQVLKGQLAVGQTNNDSELFGPGVYVRNTMTGFQFEGFFSAYIDEHTDIISSNLTICRVPRNHVRLIEQDFKSVLLGPGVHVFDKSNTVKLHDVQSQTDAEFSLNALHVHRVKTGEWGVVELNNGRVKLLKPGTHVFKDEPFFQWIKSISQNLTEPFSFRTLHLIRIPLGLLGLVRVNQSATILASGLHCINTGAFEFQKYASLYREIRQRDGRILEDDSAINSMQLEKHHVIKFDTITIANIPAGEVGFAMDGSHAKVIHPGIRVWKSPRFVFYEAHPRTQKVIEFPPFLFVTVNSGEVGIVRVDGKIKALQTGSYDHESEELKCKKNVVFAGHLSNGMENMRIENLEVSTSDNIPMHVGLNFMYKVKEEDAEHAMTITCNSLSADTGSKDVKELAKLIEDNIKSLAMTTLSAVMSKIKYSDLTSFSTLSADAGDDPRAVMMQRINTEFQAQFTDTLKEAGITFVGSHPVFSILPRDQRLLAAFEKQIQDSMEQRSKLQEQRFKLQLAEGAKQAAQLAADTKAFEGTADARAKMLLEAEKQINDAKRENALREQANKQLELTQAQALLSQQQQAALQQAKIAQETKQKELEQQQALLVQQQQAALQQEKVAQETKQKELQQQQALLVQQQQAALKLAELEAKVAQETKQKELEQQKLLLIQKQEAELLNAKLEQEKRQKELEAKIAELEKQKRTAELETEKTVAELTAKIQEIQTNSTATQKTLQLQLEALQKGLNTAIEVEKETALIQATATAVKEAPGLAQIFIAQAWAQGIQGLNPQITVRDPQDMTTIFQAFQALQPAQPLQPMQQPMTQELTQATPLRRAGMFGDIGGIRMPEMAQMIQRTMAAATAMSRFGRQAVAADQSAGVAQPDEAQAVQQEQQTLVKTP